MTTGRIHQGGYAHGMGKFYDELTEAPNLINEYDEVTTGGTATALDLTVYQSKVTTGGTAGNESLTLGNGSGAIVGQKKLITMVTRTHASDVIVLDHANILALDGVALQAAALDAEGEFLLVEWTGVKWQAIWANCTLTDA